MSYEFNLALNSNKKGFNLCFMVHNYGRVACME